MEFIKDPSKMIIAFLIFMLTFIGGWETASYSLQQAVKQDTDDEIQRVVGPQLATITQKLADISEMVKEISRDEPKR